MGEFADVLEQRNSFLHEQSGYVIENKGAMWKKRSGSGNVYENKGDSGQKAGMLLKRKGEEQDSGFGIQDRQNQGTHGGGRGIFWVLDFGFQISDCCHPGRAAYSLLPFWNLGCDSDNASLPVWVF
jgi:hypothetical protein